MIATPVGVRWDIGGEEWRVIFDVNVQAEVDPGLFTGTTLSVNSRDPAGFIGPVNLDDFDAVYVEPGASGTNKTNSGQTWVFVGANGIAGGTGVTTAS